MFTFFFSNTIYIHYEEIREEEVNSLYFNEWIYCDLLCVLIKSNFIVWFWELFLSVYFIDMNVTQTFFTYFGLKIGCIVKAIILYNKCRIYFLIRKYKGQIYSKIKFDNVKNCTLVLFFILQLKTRQWELIYRYAYIFWTPSISLVFRSCSNLHTRKNKER